MNLNSISFNWEVNSDRDREYKRTYNIKYNNYAVCKVVNELSCHKELWNGKNK